MAQKFACWRTMSLLSKHIKQCRGIGIFQDSIDFWCQWPGQTPWCLLEIGIINTNIQPIPYVHNICPINYHPCQESQEMVVTVNRSIYVVQFLNVSARSYIIDGSIHHSSTIQRFLYNITQQIGIFWKLKCNIQRRSHELHFCKLLNDQMFIFYAIILWIHINWNGLKY